MSTNENSGPLIEYIGGYCPVQAEGYFDDRRFYFRARGQHWSLEVYETPVWEQFGFWPYGPFAAGWMDEADARRLIMRCYEMYKGTLEYIGPGVRR